MTRNKKAKGQARLHKALSGRSYTSSLRATAERDWEEDFTFLTTEELVTDFLDGCCDNLISEPIRYPANQQSDGKWMDVELPNGLSEPAIHEIVVHPGSGIVNLVEEYEGGTQLCIVTAHAGLKIDGLMAKADAVASVEAGLAEMLDFDFNDHYAQVVIEMQIEVEFDATVNPDYQSVEEFTYIGASQIA